MPQFGPLGMSASLPLILPSWGWGSYSVCIPGLINQAPLGVSLSGPSCINFSPITFQFILL
jgi:hypothetical protein